MEHRRGTYTFAAAITLFCIKMVISKRVYRYQCTVLTSRFTKFSPAQCVIDAQRVMVEYPTIIRVRCKS